MGALEAVLPERIVTLRVTFLGGQALKVDRNLSFHSAACKMRATVLLADV